MPRRAVTLPAPLAFLLPLALAACSRAAAQPVDALRDASRADSPVTAPAADAAAAPAAPAAIAEPDGNDDPVADTGTGPLPTNARWERVGRPPLAHRRICDLRVLGDALYAAHAVQPLGRDGATITRYRAGDARPFTVAFDWNRPGEPSRTGGAGQGFLRVRAIDGRLFVADADPPNNGFAVSDGGTEGFVFVSDRQGHFAPARGEHFRPPAFPTPEGRPGAAALPRAYHVLDVVRFRGRLYASTGSVPPRERAWRGPSPGALHVANARWSRWTYEVDYPYPWRDGVWRLGYLVRFRGRLYAGIQDYDGREPNDYVVFDPPAGAASITRGDARGARVTRTGGALTLRWYADAGRLYWIAFDRELGRTFLRVTDDGDTWREVTFPADAGRLADVTRFRGALVALTERGLYRADGPPGSPAALVARVDDARSPFVVDDAFCAAPLAVYRGDLYAGGQRDGSLYRLVAR